MFFNEQLFEDPDTNVKEAATLLDRLIKDVVTRSADQFDLNLFIPLLKLSTFVM